MKINVVVEREQSTSENASHVIIIKHEYTRVYNHKTHNHVTRAREHKKS
jgi:hypothetical protein